MTEEFKHIIRIANTDLVGKKQILIALTKIKGVSIMFANTICKLTKIDGTKKAGDLTEQDAEKLTEALKNPLKYGAPAWIVNRRKDYETGADFHLLGGDLQFADQNDLKRLKKIKSYRGLRLQWGLPVRGQRTKSNFRRQKGKSLGVKKKK
ncbi:MAG: 30S ribosomal protein S13 [Nanoarchaeota archaeon]|nr:30S ribosomal protein S13 [Nanoarchaeota archaeon]MBU1030100.1 30S ribosomal protein S13 [Nanoarchaeota archaeon]MBU1849938.1 30S ribosomal protein S13 [Nanoarchaeota archaeon]